MTLTERDYLPSCRCVFFAERAFVGLSFEQPVKTIETFAPGGREYFALVGQGHRLLLVYFAYAAAAKSTLREFVAIALQLLGPDWRDHVIQDQKLFRPAAIMFNSGDPSKAKAQLGWVAKLQGRAVV